MSSAPIPTTAAPTRYLLDAGILVRLSDPSDPRQAAAINALRTITESGDELFITPQTLHEWLAVATRPPADRGLGWTPARAVRQVRLYRAGFALLLETGAGLDEWERLIESYKVNGKPTHDARFVAAMKVYGLTHFLTFNPKHFRRYEAGESMTVVDPASIQPLTSRAT